MINGGKSMSVEFWRNAERFYEFWFIIISMLLLLSIIVIIFIVTYARKEHRLKYILVITGISMIFVFTGFLGHLRYRSYLDQASYINPLIRDRVPRMMGYIEYRTSEENHYTQLNDLYSLRNLMIYEEERVTEPLTYLGHGEYFYYFKRSNGQLFKQNRHIEFVEMAQQTQLIGSRFFLKDKSFQKIGFKNPENTMFEYIIVPASEQGKIYESEDDLQIPRTEEEIRRWNF